MIALGVLLLALAVLVGVVVSLEATESVSIDFLGWNLVTDGVGAFWIGAGSMLVAVVALALIARGTRRGYQVRKENRQLRKEHRRMEKQRAQDVPPAAPAEPPANEDPHRPPPPAGT
ncbi:LapA family protein [Mumia quercus]|uniref:LapA family protein n=1 Tax=Mumia quercus TaxID=2976125 RepID=UPI0021CEB378|nr:LapA family protein [Mumia quercus]